MKDLRFTPVSIRLPEHGTECVVKMCSLMATAFYDYTGKWTNDNYVDGFEQSDITEWLAITDLGSLPAVPKKKEDNSFSCHFAD